MTTCIVQVSPQVGSHELNELFASAWPDHRETDFAPLLECALFYVCAYQDKRLVGFAKVIGDGGVHGFLLDPTVAFDRQRNGIGKQLVNACMEEARGRGIAWLHVDYVPQLRQFYASCGFAPTEAGLLDLKKVLP